MTMLTEVSRTSLFGGFQCIYKHFSNELKCDMTFGVYLPPQAQTQKVPVLYWLSGLTCTPDYFISQIRAQKDAAEHGICLVNPDTSPRGCGISCEDDEWNFGSGAGYYIDATEQKWKENYRMYSYVAKELPQTLAEISSIDTSKAGIFGHSMGGHGSMMIYLKNPHLYKSVSAIAPMCNPSVNSFGRLALSGYLGDDKNKWEEYDSCCLVEKYSGEPIKILIDHGSKDHVTSQMLPQHMVDACEKNELIDLDFRLQKGYGHGEDFIRAFVSEHIKYHSDILSNA